MKINKKIHKNLQEKALDKAIKKLVGGAYFGYWHIDDGKLFFKVEDKVIKFMEDLNFDLPSWNEISKYAKKIYKNFDDTVADNVMYNFSFLTEEKDLRISAKDSDIVLGHNNFTNLIITDANNVKVYGSALEDGGIDINANSIRISRLDGHMHGNLNLKSSILVFEDIYILYANNMNFNSEMIEFKKSYLFSDNNINLKSDLILTEKSRLSAVNEINIIDSNLDEIKEVDAPIITYNGVDISNAESIIIPKLRRNLIDVLRKVRNQVKKEFDNELNIEKIKKEQELNNKPITKILKK